MANIRCDESKNDLRRKILDATRHLLVEEGHNNLSMRKIARSIGYSATSIYLHFDDKDHLFHTLIDEGLEQVFCMLQDAYEAEYDDPLICLEKLCRTFVSFGLENPEYYEIMFLVDTAHMERYPAKKYRRARRNLDLIASTLEEASKLNSVHVENPDVMASTIWAFLHGTISLVLAQRLDVRIDRDLFIETSIRQVIRSISTDHHTLLVTEDSN